MVLMELLEWYVLRFELVTSMEHGYDQPCLRISSANATIFMWYTVSIVIVQMLATVQNHIHTWNRNYLLLLKWHRTQMDQKNWNQHRMCEYIRIPEAPGGIFNAIYLVNLNPTIFVVWKLKMANWKFSSNNTKDRLQCLDENHHAYPIECAYAPYSVHIHVGAHSNITHIFIHSPCTLVLRQTVSINI